MKVIISNVKHEEFEGFEFIWLDYDYKDGFGTLSIDDDNESREFKINHIHMDYTFYNEDFKHIVDYINDIMKGKDIKEVLNTLRGV